MPNPHAYEVRYFYQDIWTTLADAQKGIVKVYNEYFFRDLSAYRMEWELLHDGRIVRTGSVESLSIAPHQTKDVTLDYGTIGTEGEWLLNVKYVLKNAEGMLPAGHTVAYDQLTLKAYEAPALEFANVKESNQDIIVPEIDATNSNYLVVKGENFDIEFNKYTGYLTVYEVEGISYLEPGTALAPNFWRAPTDNDFGAGLQQKYVAWKNPGIRLTSLKSEMENDMVKVSADYELKAVSATLSLTYLINNKGAVKVVQAMKADPNAKVSDMFRFGMNLMMPRQFETISFYGRGPWENYSDRNHSTPLGVYRQQVDDQYYPYIRPQESGNKTDLRWWQVINKAGNGLMFVSEAPFSASALPYRIEDLDEGWVKIQRHSGELDKAGMTSLCIDKAQMGLGCVNSWGALPLEKYRLPYGDYEFTFIMSPCWHQVK